MGARSLGKAVLVEGDGLRVIKYAVSAAIRERRRNGMRSGPLLDEMLAAVDAALSEPGHADGQPTVVQPDSELELIDTAGAARLLGLSTRQVRRLAPTLDGTLTRNGWVFHRGSVTDYHEGRQHGRHAA